MNARTRRSPLPHSLPGGRRRGQGPWRCAQLAAALALCVAAPAPAEVSVTTVDLLAPMGLQVNAAGPLLVRADDARHRVVVANALTSSISLVDGATDSVRNISTARRALQHLKNAALAIHRASGRIYLVADHALVVADPDAGTSVALPTEVQFESVAVDEATGNAFVAGRESGSLGFYEASSGRLRLLPWLEYREDLVNLNQTPPPPIRRVVALQQHEDGPAAVVVALDGFEPALHRFDPATGTHLGHRDLDLPPAARWHLAGVDAHTRHLYLVLETARRRAVAAACLAVDGSGDRVVRLPGLTEPSGVIHNSHRGEVYIPYDNASTLHVVTFTDTGRVTDIALPTFGNNATALSPDGQRLYVASWPLGEIEVVDLRSGAFERRHQDLGILPHMFAMTCLAGSGDLYFPVGATAVNGCFGAGLTRLDPRTGATRTIHLGFAPVDLVEAGGRMLVFGNEDRMAEVRGPTDFTVHRLPRRFPLRAALAPHGDVYLAYGPHQSYWPTVYIWGARNGLLAIDPGDLSLYDRRLVRQPLAWAFDGAGRLWLTQNPWSREKAFLVTLPDGVREVDMGQRLDLDDEVERETTQRLLEYDRLDGRLYQVRTGEEDADPSVLHVIDPQTRQSLRRVEVAPGATDLAFDARSIYVASFLGDCVSIVDKATGNVHREPVSGSPLRLARLGGRTYALTHRDPKVVEIGRSDRAWPLPLPGRADNLLVWGDRLVAIGHSPDALGVVALDPVTGSLEELLVAEYPYGDTRFDTANSAFYMTGQYGDAIFHLTRARVAADGALWLADLLSGRVFALRPSGDVPPTPTE